MLLSPPSSSLRWDVGLGWVSSREGASSGFIGATRGTIKRSGRQCLRLKFSRRSGNVGPPMAALGNQTCRVCHRLAWQIAIGGRSRQVCELCGVPACSRCSRRVKLTGGTARTCVPCGNKGTVECPCGKDPQFADTIRCSDCDTWECAAHWRVQNCCPDCGPKRGGPPSEDSSGLHSVVRPVPPWRVRHRTGTDEDVGSSSSSLPAGEAERMQWECPGWGECSGCPGCHFQPPD